MEWFLYDNFNPRSPRGERHSDVKTLFTCDTISIHAPCEGSDLAACVGKQNHTVISIHAPREGSDAVLSRLCIQEVKISIHAPREGSDAVMRVGYVDTNGFQSTLPARGATKPLCQSPFAENISIHAPREGSDIDHNEAIKTIKRFQSTPPARGATLTENEYPAHS